MEKSTQFSAGKNPVMPLINKLRFIHIYEADWSMIQKFFVSYKINKIACYTSNVPVEQAGARPGRSAIEMGVSLVITYETIRKIRLNGGVIYNDSKACYDRIIENVSNLALIHQGLRIKIAKLHSQTFHSIEYTIKHKLGLGANTHKHTQPAPIYGVGQGACDAPARWGFLCDALIKVYKSLGTDAVIHASISDIITNLKIAAFVDDTALLSIISRHLSNYIQVLLQSDAQLWEKLLYTSGGKLEIPKCNFSVFDWDFDKFGRAHLIEPPFSNLQVTSSDNHKQLVIPVLKTNSSYKYVGIHIALDGNMTAHIQDLQTKCKQIALLFTQSYFNAKDSEQGFMTIYSPIVKYALPTTSISENSLQIIQQPDISSVLSRLGYNKNMPRAIIHASSMYGGVGLLDLFTEQGCSQIQLILEHLRTQKYLHNQIISLLESYQVLTGITTPALENIVPITYVHSPWTNTVRQFFLQIDATITIPQLQTIHCIRQNDKAIMDSTTLSLYSKSEQEMINACRLFLKVNTIELSYWYIINNQPNKLKITS
jgi:hypothetical protein